MKGGSTSEHCGYDERAFEQGSRYADSTEEGEVELDWQESRVERGRGSMMMVVVANRLLRTGS
jgi:hypothetical protein